MCCSSRKRLGKSDLRGLLLLLVILPSHMFLLLLNAPIPNLILVQPCMQGGGYLCKASC
jgi:hypothetical protein